MKVVVLSGGVGGARFLVALARVIDPVALTAIVNTADDDTFHGLHVAPDLDSVVYALAGESDRERGWGLADESFRAFEALKRFEPDAWFRLGDRDLATHVHRTHALAEGRGLAGVTAEIADGFGVASRVLPMTEDVVRTIVETDSGPLPFQAYHVRERSMPSVQGVRYDGAETARPAPGVVDAIRDADAVLVAPSNPVSSIGPILAMPAIRRALAETVAPVVALSGLKGGTPFRGDAARLLVGTGRVPAVDTIADLYTPFLGGLVVDRADRHACERLAARGLVVDWLDTSLDGEQGARVASACLAVAERVKKA